MYYFVARQAIFDENNNVVAYELLYRDGNNNSFPVHIDSNQATSRLITQSHLVSGLEAIVQNKLAFVNFSEDTLLHNFPTSFDPKTVIIEVLEDVPISDELISTCNKLHEAGYQIAFDDFDFDPRWEPLTPYISIIKVDILEYNILQIAKMVRDIDTSKITLLAEKVETREQYNKLKQLGFTLFQGYFFAKPEILKQRNITPAKHALFDLIGETAKPELDLDKVTEIIQCDVALSYKLLRFINSAAFSNQQEIASLKHALVYMGQVELKKFISLIALSRLCEDKTDELISMSIVRAKFCSNIAIHRLEPENPPTAFLTGLFSLIDAMLDMTLDEVMAMLPVQDEIKAAIIKFHGQLGEYLTLAIAYEKADWEVVMKLVDSLELTDECIHDAYYEAIKWANSFVSIK
ncbi:EAL and HDOD domain-containing protein [Flocculibacter collagenilyticus]|uniref:EAL and HDOD domain-containing protein n=1 Tax=Flocculibacter collagenilyticus TaxID=2744479 RepID=UPI0018F56CC9|nr:HDOD domain-containing protein [Flocculibacter collagenilyticus]